MMMIHLKDNQIVPEQILGKISDSDIVDTPVSDLCKCPNLLIFPYSLGAYGDGLNDADKRIIYRKFNRKEGKNELWTGNIAGFINIDGVDLHITSRFTGDGDDYFLHYLLGKVLSINLFNLKTSAVKDPELNFLALLFPCYLKKAMTQGVFKKYIRVERNDANVRGAIDISRHIRENTPFKGTVAYTAREYSYDNYLTQLVRHTIEYLRTTEIGRMVLNNDQVTREDVQVIVEATRSYNQRDRQNIINRNLKPLVHPYFSAYTPLQTICLKILRHKKLKYSNQTVNDKIHGILFDVAWLWEEYLATLLKKSGFEHPQNKIGKGGRRILNDENILSEQYKGFMYPDFHTEDGKLILDAKYKPLQSGVNRNDLYQMITYMHCYGASQGGFIYPCSEEEKTDIRTSQLVGKTDETISTIPFIIPQKDNWTDFRTAIESAQERLNESLRKSAQPAPTV